MADPNDRILAVRTPLTPGHVLVAQAAKDVRAVSPRSAGLALASDVDAKRNVGATELGTEHLDTVTTPGVYSQSTNLKATLSAGYPTTRGGVLQVEQSASKTMVWQTYTTYAPTATTPPQTWQRGSYNGTWSAWAPIGGGGVEGSVPIFATLAEAQAWEAKNPGKKALTLEPSTPDTTPPTWTASLTVGQPTSTSVVVTASALATDDRSVAYEVSTAGASGPWRSITPEGKNFTITGAPSTSYTMTKLRAVDAAGNSSAVLSVPSYTMAAKTYAPGDIITSETFTASGPVAGRPTDAALGGSPLTMSGGGSAGNGVLSGTMALPVTQLNYTLRFKVAAVGTTDTNIYVRSSANMAVALRLMSGSTRVLVQGPDGAAFKGDRRAAEVGDTVEFTVKDNQGTLVFTPPSGTPITATFTLEGNLGQVGPDFRSGTGWAFDDVVVVAA